MKHTNPIFTIKNFRSFGEEGIDFELAPITVLTGCNSAGKSSLVKALILLSKQQIQSEWNMGGERKLPSLYLKASSRELKLGGFSNIVNASSDKKEIEFSYSVWSEFLHEEVICKTLYKPREGVLNDGKISVFVIEKNNGEVIFSGIPSSAEIFSEEEGLQEVDFMSEEFHPETIEKNYEKFSMVSNYAYPMMLADVLGEKAKGYKKLVENIEKGKEFLCKNGISELEAKEYDIEVVKRWRNAVRENVDEIILNDKEVLKKEVYYNLVINEIVSPWFVGRLTAVDASTNMIRRIYSVEDTDKLSALLCDIVNTTNDYKYCTGKFVNKWLQLFGIGDSLEIEGTDEGLGVRVIVLKKGERRLLADEGCGLTQIVSLLLQIDRIKLHNCKNGFGIDGKEKITYDRNVISVEEPEVHLHPKYQSMLADLFVEAFQKYNIHFIIETHSEYLIRKLQVMVADKGNSLTSNDVSLNYVEKNENGISTNRKIEIMDDGRLSEAFGSGFYDEADGLAMNLLKYKTRRK